MGRQLGFQGFTDPPPEPVGEPDCESCKLYEGRNSRNVQPYGQNQLEIALVGEAPGGEEDAGGIPFIGQAGGVLRTAVEAAGQDLDRDFTRFNVCGCRPPVFTQDGRTIQEKPTLAQLTACRPGYLANLQAHQPRVIVLLGGSAIKGNFVGRWGKGQLGSTDAVSAWCGFEVPDLQQANWVVAAPHPAAVLHDLERGRPYTESGYWWPLVNAIRQALRLRTTPLPHPPELKVNIVDNILQIDEMVDHFLTTAQALVIDYECKDAKYWERGPDHVLSVSFTNPDTLETWVLPISAHRMGKPYWSQNQRDCYVIPAIGKLTASDLLKIAHNVKFEILITRCALNLPWEHPWTCTSARQHLIHEKSPANLAFQAFVTNGALWKHQANSYINGKMDRMPFDDLVAYNGQDTFEEARLFRWQEVNRFDGMDGAEEIQIDLIDRLCNIEPRGIRINTSLLTTEKAKVESEIGKHQTKFMETDAVKAVEQEVGKFNIRSPIHMKKLIYDKDKLAQPVFKTTVKTQQPSTDKEVIQVLAATGVEGMANLQRARELASYLSNSFGTIANHLWSDGYVRPSLRTDNAETYRISAEKPNIQNQRLRVEIGQDFRRVFVPDPGHLWLKLDLSQIEFRVAALLAQDQKALAAIRNHYDVHGDFVWPLFCGRIKVPGYEWVPQTQPDRSWSRYKEWKKLRQRAKNEFVFATLFGSFWKNIARTMALPEENLEYANQLFVHEILPGIAAWQQTLWRVMCMDGYIENPFALRSRAPKSYTQTVNFPVQSTALGFLVNPFIEIGQIAEKEKWESRILTQVHDEIDFSVAPSELEHVFYTATKAMTRCRWSWAESVPVEAEASIGPNWFDQEFLWEGDNQKLEEEWGKAA